ncbi:telomere-associated protein RIF1-like [Crotalus tigris]|uniref:telomere-associated protein RIF1-like n=1 Tax=Crotalus tigris TaxID=88082 RepID=UPI00192F6827|nr:telomere-associated protein RIF1-like [Crotalus tigris]
MGPCDGTSLRALLETLEDPAASLGALTDALLTLTNRLTEDEEDEDEGRKLAIEIENCFPQLYKIFMTYIPSENAELSSAALQALGYCVFNPNMSCLLCEIEIHKLLSTLNNVALNSGDKHTCTRALWVISKQSFPPDTVAKLVPSIIAMLETVLEGDLHSMVVEYEALNVIIRLIEQAPSNMEQQAVKWAKIIIPLVVHSARKIQLRAASALEMGLPLLQQHQEVITITEQIMTTKVIPELQKLFFSKHETYILKLWPLFIKLLGKTLHHNGSFINSLLYLEELGFRSGSPVVKKIAFIAWKSLIDNFALNPDILCSAKRLRLLMQPLSSIHVRTETLAVTKLEVWWYLLIRLGSQLPVHFEQVGVPLIQNTLCLDASQLQGNSSRFISNQSLAIPGSSQISGVFPFGNVASPRMTQNASIGGAVVIPSIQILGIEMLLHFFKGQEILTFAEENNIVLSLEPLQYPVITSLPFFCKHASVFINAAQDGFIAVGKEISDCMLTAIWKELVGFVKAAIEPGNKREQSNSEVLTMLLQTLKNIIMSKQLPVLNSLSLLEVAIKELPPKVLGSPAYLIADLDLLNGTPALFLLQLLFFEDLLEYGVQSQRFFLNYESLVECAVSGPTSPLSFTESVLTIMSQSAIYLENKNYLWQMWTIIVNPLIEWIKQTNDVNQGDALEHNFSAIYSALLLPVNCIFSSEFPQSSAKILLRSWSELYKAFARCTLLVPTAEDNVCCDDLCAKIISGLDDEAHLNQSMLDALSCITAVMVECINFAPYDKKYQPANRSPQTPMDWAKKKKDPLGKLSSLIKLLIILTNSLQRLASEQSGFEELAPVGFEIVGVLQNIIGHISLPSVVRAVFGFIAKPLAALYEKITSANPSRMSYGLDSKCEKLLADSLTCVQSNYTGSFNSELLEELCPLLTIMFLNNNKQISSHAAQFWNATFGKAVTLTYPEELKSVLNKAKQKFILLLPVFESCEIMEGSSTAYSDYTENSQWDANISGMTVNPNGKRDSFLAQINEPEEEIINVHIAPKKIKLEFSGSKSNPKNIPLEEENTMDFVFIPLEAKERVLTEHQKEVLRTKRDDIPVMYNNLDTSQDAVLFSRDTQNQEDSLEKPIVVDIKEEHEEKEDKLTAQKKQARSHQLFKDDEKILPRKMAQNRETPGQKEKAATLEKASDASGRVDVNSATGNIDARENSQEELNTSLGKSERSPASDFEESGQDAPVEKLKLCPHYHTRRAASEGLLTNLEKSESDSSETREEGAKRKWFGKLRKYDSSGNEAKEEPESQEFCSQAAIEIQTQSVGKQKIPPGRETEMPSMSTNAKEEKGTLPLSPCVDLKENAGASHPRASSDTGRRKPANRRESTSEPILENRQEPSPLDTRSVVPNNPSGVSEDDASATAVSAFTSPKTFLDMSECQHKRSKRARKSRSCKCCDEKLSPQVEKLSPQPKKASAPEPKLKEQRKVLSKVTMALTLIPKAEEIPLAERLSAEPCATSTPLPFVEDGADVKEASTVAESVSGGPRDNAPNAELEKLARVQSECDQPIAEIIDLPSSETISESSSVDPHSEELSAQDHSSEPGSVESYSEELRAQDLSSEPGSVESYSEDLSAQDWSSEPGSVESYSEDLSAQDWSSEPGSVDSFSEELNAQDRSSEPGSVDSHSEAISPQNQALEPVSMDFHLEDVNAQDQGLEPDVEGDVIMESNNDQNGQLESKTDIEFKITQIVGTQPRERAVQNTVGETRVTSAIEVAELQENETNEEEGAEDNAAYAPSELPTLVLDSPPKLKEIDILSLAKVSGSPGTQTRFLWSPTASPSTSILKRVIKTEHDSSPPPNKNQRVSFANPIYKEELADDIDRRSPVLRIHPYNNDSQSLRNVKSSPSHQAKVKARGMEQMDETLISANENAVMAGKLRLGGSPDVSVMAHVLWDTLSGIRFAPYDNGFSEDVKDEAALASFWRLMGRHSQVHGLHQTNTLKKERLDQKNEELDFGIPIQSPILDSTLNEKTPNGSSNSSRSSDIISATLQVVVNRRQAEKIDDFDNGSFGPSVFSNISVTLTSQFIQKESTVLSDISPKGKPDLKNESGLKLRARKTVSGTRSGRERRSSIHPSFIYSLDIDNCITIFERDFISICCCVVIHSTFFLFSLLFCLCYSPINLCNLCNQTCLCIVSIKIWGFYISQVSPKGKPDLENKSGLKLRARKTVSGTKRSHSEILNALEMCVKAKRSKVENSTEPKLKSNDMIEIRNGEHRENISPEIDVHEEAVSKVNQNPDISLNPKTLRRSLRQKGETDGAVDSQDKKDNQQKKEKQKDNEKILPRKITQNRETPGQKEKAKTLEKASDASGSVDVNSATGNIDARENSQEKLNMNLEKSERSLSSDFEESGHDAPVEKLEVFPHYHTRRAASQGLLTNLEKSETDSSEIREEGAKRKWFGKLRKYDSSGNEAKEEPESQEFCSQAAVEIQTRSVGKQKIPPGRETEMPSMSTNTKEIGTNEEKSTLPLSPCVDLKENTGTSHPRAVVANLWHGCQRQHSEPSLWAHTPLPQQSLPKLHTRGVWKASSDTGRRKPANRIESTLEPILENRQEPSTLDTRSVVPNNPSGVSEDDASATAVSAFTSPKTFLDMSKCQHKRSKRARKSRSCECCDEKLTPQVENFRIQFSGFSFRRVAELQENETSEEEGTEDNAANAPSELPTLVLLQEKSNTLDSPPKCKELDFLSFAKVSGSPTGTQACCVWSPSASPPTSILKRVIKREHEEDSSSPANKVFYMICAILHVIICILHKLLETLNIFLASFKTFSSFPIQLKTTPTKESLSPGTHSHKYKNSKKCLMTEMVTEPTTASTESVYPALVGCKASIDIILPQITPNTCHLQVYIESSYRHSDENPRKELKWPSTGLALRESSGASGLLGQEKGPRNGISSTTGRERRRGAETGEAIKGGSFGGKGREKKEVGERIRKEKAFVREVVKSRGMEQNSAERSINVMDETLFSANENAVIADVCETEVSSTEESSAIDLWTLVNLLFNQTSPESLRNYSGNQLVEMQQKLQRVSNYMINSLKSRYELL